ncbi:FlgO family outer membrane protein [Runella salmonicolor]|uniref:CsgG/HfaB family protein n=1 Tax=Runella salmonicolor TaxID=2950278 RepID=A0ABT1FWT3_9BACT|nr:FlgO family outer membrane protein [Runella salmonicolor]MCP1386230.1 CsgG/HfaB family protein [Runella salmonicolor]
MKRILLFLLLGCTLVQPALAQESDIDTKMEKMAQDLAKQLRAAGKSRVGVAEFTDPQSYVTELGKYFADNFQGTLVQQKLRVINRQRLSQLLTENKLTAKGLLDPNNSLKIGKAANMEVIIVGTVTTLSNREFAIELLALDVQGAEAIASAKTKILRTVQLDKMQETIVPQLNISQPESENLVEQGLTPSNEQRPTPSNELCNDKAFYLGQVCFENRTKQRLILYEIVGAYTKDRKPNTLVGTGKQGCTPILRVGVKSRDIKVVSATFYFHTSEQDESKRLYGKMNVEVEACKVKNQSITTDNLFLNKKRY